MISVLYLWVNAYELYVQIKVWGVVLGLALSKLWPIDLIHGLACFYLNIQTHYLYIVYAYFHTTISELNSCNTDYMGLGKHKYLLLTPLWNKFADSLCKSQKWREA